MPFMQICVYDYLFKGFSYFQRITFTKIAIQNLPGVCFLQIHNYNDDTFHSKLVLLD